MSDSFNSDSDKKSRSKLEEEIYGDIKTYTLRRKLNKNDTFITNRENDENVRLYSPKHSYDKNIYSKPSEDVLTKSEDKKSKIRIKKQQSSGTKLRDSSTDTKKNKMLRSTNKKNNLKYEDKNSSRGYEIKYRDDDRVSNAKANIDKISNKQKSIFKNSEKVDNVRYFNRASEKYTDKSRISEKYQDSEYYEDDFMDNEYDVRPSLKFTIFKKFVTFILVLTVIGGGAGFIYVRNIVSDMPVLTKKMVQESYINKEIVPLSKIPKNLRNAVISVEDERFYSHKGIDYKSLIRSLFNNISGNMMQGGSTIDMQVSKNLLTSSERTIKRKIQDIYNARMLNKIMTKDEIFEAYLNNIYLGSSAYGVQAGAQLYFGKDVQQLTFGQATMLAGITNNPSVYQDYEYAKKRQRIVLKKMYELGYIKENVYKAQLYRDTPFKSEVDK